MEIMKEEGYPFAFDPKACESCEGECCRGESGYIWVKYPEIVAISQYIDMELENFAKIYLKKVGHRYSLVEKQIAQDDYACIFFDTTKMRCSIYPVRPLQCRTFPFWQQFKNSKDEVKKECPGIV